MPNMDMELQKVVIYNAFKKSKITKEQYEELLKFLERKEEEIRLQKKLKEFKEKEIIEKYKDLATT